MKSGIQNGKEHSLTSSENSRRVKTTQRNSSVQVRRKNYRRVNTCVIPKKIPTQANGNEKENPGLENGIQCGDRNIEEKSS